MSEALDALRADVRGRVPVVPGGLAVAEPAQRLLVVGERGGDEVRPGVGGPRQVAGADGPGLVGGVGAVRGVQVVAGGFVNPGSVGASPLEAPHACLQTSVSGLRTQSLQVVAIAWGAQKDHSFRAIRSAASTTAAPTPTTTSGMHLEVPLRPLPERQGRRGGARRLRRGGGARGTPSGGRRALDRAALRHGGDRAVVDVLQAQVQVLQAGGAQAAGGALLVPPRPAVGEPAQGLLPVGEAGADLGGPGVRGPRQAAGADGSGLVGLVRAEVRVQRVARRTSRTRGRWWASPSTRCTRFCRRRCRGRANTPPRSPSD